MPYIDKINTLLSSITGWMQSIALAVALAVAAFYAIKAIGSTGMSRKENIQHIVTTFIILAGFSALLWIGSYVYTAMN